MASIAQFEASEAGESNIFRQFFTSHPHAGPTITSPEFSSLARGPHLREFLKGIVAEQTTESIVRSLRDASETYVKECIIKEDPVTFVFGGEFDVATSHSDKSLRSTMGSRAALMVLRAYNSLSGIVGGRGFIGVMSETIRATEVSLVVQNPGRVTAKFLIKGVDAVGHADFIVGCIAYMAKTASFGSSASSLDADSVNASTKLLMLMTAGTGMKFSSPQVMVDSVSSAVKAWKKQEMPKAALLAGWALTMSYASDNDRIERSLETLRIPSSEGCFSRLASLGSVAVVLSPFETWRLKVSDRKTLKPSFQRDVDVRHHMKYSASLGRVSARYAKLYGAVPFPPKNDSPRVFKAVRSSRIVLTQDSEDTCPKQADSVSVSTDSDMPTMEPVQASNVFCQAQREQENYDDRECGDAFELSSDLESAFDMVRENPEVEVDASTLPPAVDFEKLTAGYFARLRMLPGNAVPGPATEGAPETVNPGHSSGEAPLVKLDEDDKDSAGSSLPSIRADYRVKKVLATYASCSRIAPENPEQLYALMTTRPGMVKSVLMHHYGLSKLNMIDENLIAIASRDVVTEFTAPGAGTVYLSDMEIVDVRYSLVETVDIFNTDGLLQIYGPFEAPVPLLDLAAIKQHVAGLALGGAKVYLNPPSTLFFGIHALRVAEEIASTGLASQIFVVLWVTATPSTDDIGGLFNGARYPAIANWPGRYAIISVLQEYHYMMVLTLVGADEDPYDVLYDLLDVASSGAVETIRAVTFRPAREIVIGPQRFFTELAKREEANLVYSKFEHWVNQVAYDFADLLWSS